MEILTASTRLVIENFKLIAGGLAAMLVALKLYSLIAKPTKIDIYK